MVTALLQIGGTVAVLAALIAWTGPTARWFARRWARRRAERYPTSQRRPIQLVAADVRRLARELSLVPAGTPMVRRRALAAALDDVLLEAAELLEVPNGLGSTPPGPARDAERRRLLAELERAGLVVRS